MIIADDASVLLQVAWDWSTEFGPAQEMCKVSALMFNRAELDLSKYPRDVRVTRARFRGTGRAAVLRFSSSPDKDFCLAGYSIEGQARDKAEGVK